MEEVSREVIIGVVTGTLFILLFSLLMMLVLINFLRRKKKLMYEKKVMEAKFQQELLQAQLEMQEHTFKTVSQEIHDNVGQILSLAKVNLSILAMEEKANEKINNITDLVGKAIRELRDLSAGYYADRLAEEGLIIALQHELNQLEKTGLLTTRFHSSLQRLPLDKHTTIFLYRMFQEICNNVLKHAGATHVDVSISPVTEGFCILVKDNGKGFDESKTGFKPGIGLSSMRERAAMIGASISIDSEPGTGTTIQLTFKADSHDQDSIGR
jgi:signal transduction histidine kinase